MNKIVEPGYPIAVVERDTGIGKDTLRVWERRYGFPQPFRDASGDRLYPPAQVERLRLIRRLMDMGHRPGRLLAAPEDELHALSGSAGATSAAASGARPGGRQEGMAETAETPANPLANRVVEALMANDVASVRQLLSQSIMSEGLQRFVLDEIPEMNLLIGEAWGRGELQVFEEHLYTELLQTHLRQAIARLPAGNHPPRIVLTTVPDEQHALGILMLEALYTMQGATCISLGTQTPLSDMVRAANAHQADVIALSFSAAFPPRQVGPLIDRLREALPASVAMWVGGSGTQKLALARGRVVAGVEFGVTLEDAQALLANWKAGGN